MNKCFRCFPEACAPKDLCCSLLRRLTLTTPLDLYLERLTIGPARMIPTTQGCENGQRGQAPLAPHMAVSLRLTVTPLSLLEAPLPGAGGACGTFWTVLGEPEAHRYVRRQRRFSQSHRIRLVSLRLTVTLLFLYWKLSFPAPEALADFFGRCSVSQRLTAMCGAKGALAISPNLAALQEQDKACGRFGVRRRRGHRASLNENRRIKGLTSSAAFHLLKWV